MSGFVVFTVVLAALVLPAVVQAGLVPQARWYLPIKPDELPPPPCKCMNYRWCENEIIQAECHPSYIFVCCAITPTEDTNNIYNRIGDTQNMTIVETGPVPNNEVDNEEKPSPVEQTESTTQQKEKPELETEAEKPSSTTENSTVESNEDSDHSESSEEDSDELKRKIVDVVAEEQESIAKTDNLIDKLQGHDDILVDILK